MSDACHGLVANPCMFRPMTVIHLLCCACLCACGACSYIVPIAFPPTKVVLEVDAPPELAAEDQEEAQELTSQQEARAAHLTSLGYQVLRLNYYPWRRQSELNRKSHLRDLTLVSHLTHISCSHHHVPPSFFRAFGA